jgi:hypothetical protein
MGTAAMACPTAFGSTVFGSQVNLTAPMVAAGSRGTRGGHGTGGHGIPHRAIVGTRKNRGARLLHEL